MQDESNRPPQIEPRLKQALSHPMRIEILGYLMQSRDGMGTSERELAAALDLTVSQAEYHLTVLHNAGLIVRVKDQPQQGEGGRSYVAAARACRSE